MATEHIIKTHCGAGAGAVAVIPVSSVKLPVFAGVKTEDWFQAEAEAEMS